MKKPALLDGEEYRSIFENATEGIYQSNITGRFIRVNPAMARIFGYESPADMVTSVTNISKQIYVNKQDRQQFIEELQSSGKIEGFECRNYRKDKSIIWIRTNARAVFDDEGQVKYIEGFLTEITAQKTLDTALKKNEDRYRALVEGIPAVVFLDSPEEKEIPLYISPQIEDLLGYTQEEWIADEDIWEDSLHPDDRARVLREDKRTDNSGERFQMEYRLRKNNGEYLWIREESSLIRDDSGSPLYWQGFFIDINERKIAEKTLLSSEERFKSIFTATPIAICLSTLEEGQLLSANPAFWSLSGRGPNQSTENKFPDLGSFKSKKERATFVAALKEKRRLHGVEKTIIKPDNQSLDTIAYYDLMSLNGNECILAMYYDVSEKRMFEESLQESEASYRTLFNNVSEAIYIQDSEGRFIDVNEGAMKMYGYPKEFFLGNTPEVLSAPKKNDLKAIHAAVKKAFKGERQQFEFWGIRSNGEIFPKEVRLCPGIYSGENVIIAMAQDITEQKIVEDTLRESEARYKSLAEASNDMIYIIGKDGVVEYVNSFAARQFKVEAQALIGKSMEGMFPSEIARHQEQNIHNVFQSGNSNYIEAKTEFPDKTAWLGTWLVPLTNTDGKIESIMGVSRDITERKQVEEALHESEQRLRAIIENTRTVYFSHTPDNKLTFISPQVSEILGYSPEEALVDWTEFLTDNPLNKEGLKLTQNSIRTGKQQEPFALELKHKEGQHVWVEVRESPIVHERKTIAVVGALTDITERKQSDERLTRQLEELTILHQVALAATSSKSVDELIEQVTNIISNTLYPDNCGIELLSESGKNLNPHPSYHGASGDLIRWELDLSQGIAGKAARTGKTIRLGDVSKDPDYIEATVGVRSELAVPIKIQGSTIGVMNAESKQLNAFTDSDERLLNTIAGTLAIGIQQLRLFEDEQTRRLEAETLREITTALTTSLNSHTLFESIFDSIAKIIQFDSASIALLKDGAMEIVGGRGFPKGLDVVGRHLPSQGVWTQLPAERRPIIIPDVQTESDFDKWEGSEYIRGWIGIPLFAHDNWIGAIHLDSKKVGAFTERHATILQTFANSVAVAIENTKLYEEAIHAAERRAVLYRLSQDIVRLVQDPEKTYAAIHQATQELMPCDAFAIILRNGDKQENVAVFLKEKGKRYPDKTIPAGEGLTADILSKGKSVIIRDLNKDEINQFIHFGSKKSVRSILAVPLRIGKKVIGMLSAQSYLPDAYREEEQTLLEMLAAHAVAAVENIRFFTAEQKNRRLAEILREASATLTTTIEPKELYKIILDAAAKLVPYDSACIELIDQDDLVIVAGKGLPKKSEYIGLLYPFDSEKWGDPDTINEPILVSDVQKDPRFKLFEETNYTRSWMGVPLISKEKLIGFLNFDSKTKEFFTKEQGAFAQIFGNQAAVAIENALLYAKEQTLRQRSAILLELMRITASSLELDEVMQTFLHRLIELVPSTSGTIQLLERDFLRIAARAGLANQILPIGTLLPISEYPLNAKVLRTKQPAYVTNVEDDSDYTRLKGTEAIRSFLCIPLVFKNRAIGLVTLDNTQESQYGPQEIELAQAVARYAAISIENARSYEAEQLRRQESETLREAALAITTSLELGQVLETILVAMKKVIPYDSASVLFEQNETLQLAATQGFSDEAYLTSLTFPSNDHLYQEIKQSQKAVILADAQKDSRFHKWGEAASVHGWMGVPLIIRGEVIGCITVDNRQPKMYDETSAVLAQAFSNQASAAIQNARQFQAEQRHFEEAETLRQAAESINSTLDIRLVLTSILDNLNRVVPFDSAGVFLLENDKVRLTALRGMPDGEASIDRSFPASNALLQEVLKTNQPLILKDAQEDPRYEKWVVGEQIQIRGWMGVPLIVRGTTIGFITMDSFKQDAYKEHDATLAITFAHQAAAAIENARLFERGEKQIRQLMVLRDIDSAISSSFDLKVTLNILLNHASRELNAHSAAILLYNPASYTLTYFTSIGMLDKRVFPQSDLRLGEGLAGKVILERKMVHIPNVQDSSENVVVATLSQRNSIDYFGLPLIGKGQMKGVLEIFSDSNPVPDQDWLNFLQTLAGQAAIAIDNVQLFRNLQRTNQDLSLAYDTTLEGWARALELRDKETEGHSHRVVDLTIELARQLGVEGEGLTNLKRGTLLHDIGKMGIPDNILHKPGPLTDEEWTIMRQHPVYAYELLHPIHYLRQALDIPYSHHERWDGSGYPRGLKGDAIPLAARIFAVVDVWDALLHDRPYRKAWKNKKVIDYLQEQAGQELDPEIVKVFLELLKEKDSHFQRP